MRKYLIWASVLLAGYGALHQLTYKEIDRRVHFSHDLQAFYPFRGTAVLKDSTTVHVEDVGRFMFFKDKPNYAFVYSREKNIFGRLRQQIRD